MALLVLAWFPPHPTRGAEEEAIPAPVQSAQAAAYLEQGEGMIVLGNQFLELRFDVSGAWPVMNGLVNRLSGRTLPIGGDDFIFELEGQPPIQTASCSFLGWQEETLAEGGRRLILELANPSPSAQLRLIYEINPQDFFFRRRIELTPGEPLALRRVDVWRVNVAGACWNQGFGEPVFLEDTFWGLEYPAGHDYCSSGLVTLAQYPGRTVTDLFASKTAVVGVANSGAVAEQFLRYVRTVQATAAETKLFVNYNTWWTLMPGLAPTSEANCLAIVQNFKTNLFDRHGETFDNFCIDDGWDEKNSLWDIRSDLWPNGFNPLRSALQGMNAELGLWISPSSGYLHADWGARAGYETNSYGWYLCQSGPNYRRDIVPVFTNLVGDNSLAFLKLDGFSETCEALDHGHLPGLYAQEANVDAYIELLQAVREVRPDIYLDPLWKVWLSPWWLMYTDSVWGTLSRDYPDIIVPAPVPHDSATTTRDAAFRAVSGWHPGFPISAIEHFGIVVYNEQKWEDDAMIVLGRGGRLLTLYINPAYFEDHDWAFLASILKWVRHRAATLENTKMILGNPLLRQPYGYAHADGLECIVAVRNPFIEPRQVQLSLDGSLGLPPSPTEAGARDPVAVLVPRVIYPYHQTLLPQPLGGTLDLTLSAYETLVLEMAPLNPDGPALAGVRASELSRSGRQVAYEIHAPPGRTVDVARVIGSNSVFRAELDGKRVPVEEDGSLVLAMEGEARTTSFEGGHLAAEIVGNSWEVSGECRIDLPPGSRGKIHMLVDPGRTTSSSSIRLLATINGASTQVAPLPLPTRQATLAAPFSGPSPRWQWYQFELPEGASQVSVNLRPAIEGTPYFWGEVGWWLWVEHPLRKAILTVEHAKAVPPVSTAPLPLPIGQENEREILTLQASGRLDAGNRWAGVTASNVFLDDAVPDSAKQDWGELRGGKTTWDEPMLIGGLLYTRGLGTHANSSIIYSLSGGRFDYFQAEVGHQSTGTERCDGLISFQVWLDNVKVFDSGPVDQKLGAVPVLVNLRGASVLELRTLDGEDGTYCDQANWGNARLVRNRFELQTEPRIAAAAEQGLCIPLQISTGLVLSNFVFTASFSPGLVSNPTLVVPPEVGQVTSAVTTESNAVFTVSGKLNSDFQDPLPLGQLCFTAVDPQATHASPVQITDALATTTDGLLVTWIPDATTKLAAIAQEPFLELARSSNGPPQLFLYGRVGTSYVVESTPAGGQPFSWTTNLQFVLTHPVQLLPMAMPSERTVFFRARIPGPLPPKE